MSPDVRLRISGGDPEAALAIYFSVPPARRSLDVDEVYRLTRILPATLGPDSGTRMRIDVEEIDPRSVGSTTIVAFDKLRVAWE